MILFLTTPRLVPDNSGLELRGSPQRPEPHRCAPAPTGEIHGHSPRPVERLGELMLPEIIAEDAEAGVEPSRWRGPLGYSTRAQASAGIGVSSATARASTGLTFMRI